MTYYDEHGNLINTPDMTAGYVYPHRKLDGTVVYIYHAWTAEELAAIQASEDSEDANASYEERIATLEEELAAAKILLGVE